ncbi:MAG: ABC transporter ATP-binding protein/permease [Acutalibacteraceae bacterium]|nr:ABC transporter ATP-binding protein/permease [Acutalibacteraceae bacterium]
MLKLKGIVKEYPTGDSKVVALKGVDIEFRKNEFVSILGHSGCGKTTLLNIIGGLDQYTSGDLIIEGRSTKDFKNSDWDAYRNHSVGFVFQNYNLIPHQSVLSNVELALTLSGVSKTERRKRAAEALEKVGLGDQLNKKPNQMSGGQMQRVAIARALVNNPEILLADEPTGALDTETSIQIMDLLKEISKEKLVVMVTHNPELADEYSTRIIRLIDGKIVDDSNPYSSEEKTEQKTKAEKKSASKASKKKPSMSIFTALSLSLNNLMTKKARTFLTSFAGSIGIIGIALILALSNGFQAYIDSVQQEALTSYPIMLESTGMDMNSMMNSMAGITPGEITHPLDKIYSNTMASSMMESFSSELKPNNLAAFKKYIESSPVFNNEGKPEDEQLISSVQYTYGGKLNIFSADTANGINKVYPTPVISLMESMMGNVDLGGMQIDPSMMSSMTRTMNSWMELIDNQDLLNEQYELVTGAWPSNYNEVVLIVDKNNEISDIAFQGLGLMTEEELMKTFTAGLNNEEYVPVAREVEYEDILNLKFRVVLEPDYFQYNAETKTWDDMRGDEAYVSSLIQNGEEIKVVGIIRPSDESVMVATTGAVGYTSELTTHFIQKTNECEIVKQQKANPNIDVFTGIPFVKEETVTPEASAPAASDVSLDPAINTPSLAEGVSPDASSMSFSGNAPKASFTATSGGMMDFSQFPEVSEEEVYDMISKNFSGEEAEKMNRVVELLLKNMLSINERNELAGYLDELLAGQEIEGVGKISGSQAVTFLGMMSKSDKLKMLGGIMSGEIGEMAPPVEGETSDTPAEGDTPAEVEPEPEPEPEPLAKSYEEALLILGAADIDNPKSIYIYPKNFEAKDIISDEIKKYNESVENEEDKINYTDYIGILLSSISSIINIISWVLSAFVSISLIVSSIMIGIITYISVLERTKEIGILRAIGASKKDISRVFNAETLIIGFISGALGILLTLVLSLIINTLIIPNVTSLPLSAQLPVVEALILVAISMVLTVISGLFPAKIASRKDPVEALRSE